MQKECRLAVEAVLGRELHNREVPAMDGMFTRAMRKMALKDPATWVGLPQAQRYALAAKEAVQELIATSQKVAERLQHRVMRGTEVEAYINDQVAHQRDSNGLKAMIRLLGDKLEDRNSRRMSVERRAGTIFDLNLRRLADAVEVLRPGIWSIIPWGDARTERHLIEALVGVPNKDRPAEIDAVADTFKQVMADNRALFNSVGGKVGELANYDFPHAWSPHVVSNTPDAEFIDDFMNAIDWSKYIHPDGRRYSQQEKRAFVEAAKLTIQTDGEIKGKVTRRGVMPRDAFADRNSAHRAMHLKPEATYAMYKKYMESNGWELIVNHLRAVSRDIALQETFGGPDVFFAALNKAYDAALQLKPNEQERQALDQQYDYVVNLFNEVSGNNPPPPQNALTTGASWTRTTLTYSLLGSAGLSSFVLDWAPLHFASFLRQGPFKALQLEANTWLAWSPKSRRFLRRAGLMTDAMIGTMDRFAFNNLNAQGVSQKLSGEYMKFVGLGLATTLRRSGFALTIMDTLGHLTRRYTSMASLKESDRLFLQEHGVTEEVYQVWRKAKLEKWGLNGNLLTPAALEAVPNIDPPLLREAQIKLLGMARSEALMAIIEPGARERVQMRQFFNQKEGTTSGELGKTLVMFKAIIWAVQQRVLHRAAMYSDKMPVKVAHLVTLMLMGTATGIIKAWLDDLRNGREMRSFNPNYRVGDKPIGLNNYGQAMMTGGALGFYGEFLFGQTTGYGSDPVSSFLGGPVGSTASALWANLGPNAIAEATDSDGRAFEPSGINAIRGVTPFQNLIYTKAVTDRSIFWALQEELAPGYIQRMEARQRRMRGTEYYWSPSAGVDGNLFDMRAPDPATAVQE